MSKELNNKLRQIILNRIPRTNKDSEDYNSNMGSKCKSKEYAAYIDANLEILHVMSKSDMVEIPTADVDFSILKSNLQENIVDKNGKLAKSILWFQKGENTSSVLEWFKWWSTIKKSK